MNDFDFEDTLKAKKKTLITSSSKSELKATAKQEDEYSESLNEDLLKVVKHKAKKHFDMFADDEDYNETHGVADSAAVRVHDGAENPHLTDNWDDAEGYYSK